MRGSRQDRSDDTRPDVVRRDQPKRVCDARLERRLREVAPATASNTATTPTIKLISTNKGKLLSTGGFVLYRFSRDGTGSKNTCVKVQGCPKAWPALTTVNKPHTGTGVKASLLGTTKL